MKKSIIRKLRALSRESRRELEYCFMALRPRKIIFDHIPKCGGTSLCAYLESHYPARKVFSINRRKPGISVEEFKALPQRKRYGYSLIQGHVANKLLDYVHPECVKVTVLREPVDRIVSHYYYAKRRPNHYLHSKIMEFKMGLEEYITADPSALQNYYTTHFSELTLNDAERNPKASVEKAVDDLFKIYDVIGLLDNFSFFIQDLRVHANLHHEYQDVRLNVTQDRPSLEDISLSTRKRIEEVNHLDIDFYKRVKDSISIKQRMSRT